MPLQDDKDVQEANGCELEEETGKEDLKPAVEAYRRYLEDKGTSTILYPHVRSMLCQVLRNRYPFR